MTKTKPMTLQEAVHALKEHIKICGQLSLSSEIILKPFDNEEIEIIDIGKGGFISYSSSYRRKTMTETKPILHMTKGELLGFLEPYTDDTPIMAYFHGTDPFLPGTYPINYFEYQQSGKIRLIVT